MRARLTAIVGGLLWTIVSTGAASATPPPPPPSYVDEIAREIIATPTPARFGQYAAVLANDLLVVANGKTWATDKQVWLAMERHRLGKMDRLVICYAEGRDAILVVDRLDDRSDVPDAPGLVFDPRYQARSLRYAIGNDHLIHRTDIALTDGSFRTP